ncbi:EscU/YscU/HrcU family type III secretion system export apparatus switch protein [Desulforamulus aquiferis]|uniref:EscU/YscU/HrcU family type III secretion system export apparatus switch protein n=1 Tax=Desulforamulus aquiferis TaxID=1397668 RepID=A0AAW7ZB19_9FIRM|nr:EscU/YscU/HrcU family type III secretion system export apparatus switch protein [Desulforamulus aquiferis]MDO7786582.1 EscU/YscU/HrcU family type III secretion system export apparatus switch protein [Desulforamulus aquiferis]
MTRKKAVALRYDKEEDHVPEVIAAGHSYLAEKILQIAEEKSVPVYKDPVLVEMLSHLNVGEEIPPELYNIIAEVLTFVYSLDKETRDK